MFAIILLFCVYAVNADWVDIKINKVLSTGNNANNFGGGGNAANYGNQDYYPTVAVGDRDPAPFSLPRAWLTGLEELVVAEGEDSVPEQTEEAVVDTEPEIEPLIVSIDSAAGETIALWESVGSQCFSTLTDEYNYKVCPFHNATQNQRFGDLHVVMGIWGRWDTHDSQTAMRMTDGNPCSSGKHRNTVVNFICDPDGDLEPVLSEVSEYECTYYATLTGAFACNFDLSDVNEAGDTLGDVLVYPSALMASEVEDNTLAEGGEDSVVGFIINTVSPEPASPAESTGQPDTHEQECDARVAAVEATVVEHEGTISDQQDTIASMQLCINALLQGPSDDDVGDDTPSTEVLCEAYIQSQH